MEKKKESFESSLKKLEEIVRELENGEIDLDKSMEKFKEAMNLVSYCSERLKSANETVNKIMNEDGSLSEFKVEE